MGRKEGQLALLHKAVQVSLVQEVRSHGRLEGSEGRVLVHLGAEGSRPQWKHVWQV